jgi:uncharacterized repeat protein (TIGR03803 family)
MNKLRLLTIACVIGTFCVATAVTSPAQTYTNIVNFDGENGGRPIGVTQGFDGKFYGVTNLGGKNGQNSYTKGDGTIFSVASTDALVSLYSFCSQKHCADGGGPGALLTQAADGNFYGTTYAGGSMVNCGDGCGTVFVTDGRALTTIYSFCAEGSPSSCPDGFAPQSQLVRARNGNFYGTTVNGGAYSSICNPSGCGTIFEITPQGALTTVHAFCQTMSDSRCPDGYVPSALALGTDGNLYGTTGQGGSGPASEGCPYGCGTLFRITPDGKFTTLYDFCSHTGCSDGWGSYSGVVEGTDGNLYGTAANGGAHGGGTVFKFTAAAQYVKLYDFCAQTNCADGEDSGEPLIQGTDGNFYGTTQLGGVNNNSSLCGTPGCGTIFQITPAGSFTSLYSFCSQPNCADGTGATAPLMQATNGIFYGTTEVGGPSANCAYGETCGTVFSLEVGLGPFVKTNPGAGQVGWNINVFGNGLTGTTAVSFNGTTASVFTVVSDTLIKATVPTGASTGAIEVTTPSGMLTSNIAFQVLP